MCSVIRTLPEARSLSTASEDNELAPAPIVIAHRGASAFAPEHTIVAYDLAILAGADYIEQDLQLTADGELIVLHDETLERTTGGACAGRAIATDYARIAECDAGTWFNRQFPERARPEYASLRIPRLADVFARYAGTTRFYVETKNPAEAPGMEEKLAVLIAEYGLLPATDSAPSLRAPLALPAVIVQAFSSDSLRLLRNLVPGIPRVQLIESDVATDSIVDRLEIIADYAQAIGPAHTSVDDRLIGAAHARNLAVHTYTVNDPATMRHLVAARTDAMFTDDPALLRSLIAAR